MKNFGILGVAGFVAPRHLDAIKRSGNNLSLAMDLSDSVGVLDHFFPDSAFYTNIDALESAVAADKPDFISVCTPNHLHAEHIDFVLNNGCDAICEKPLVLDPDDLDHLAKIESKTGKKVFNVLQLRLHPDITKLKEKRGADDNKKIDIDLQYITPRGKWYHSSWKGKEELSGGIATNIGIHFFDMLTWIFGPVQQNIVHLNDPVRASGFLELEQARVRWFLSIDAKDLLAFETDEHSYRSMRIADEEIEFGRGFQDLHLDIYNKVLAGSGFGIDEARASIEIVHQIRTQNPIGLKGEYHPLAAQSLKN